MKTTVSIETTSKLPDHLFIGVEGALYDTRHKNWHKSPPLRPCFSRHSRQIETLNDIKATLRAGPYAWPGGYPLFFVMADGAPVSFRGILLEWRNVASDTMAGSGSCWQPIALEVNYETVGLFCEITGELIPAAYIGDEENQRMTEQGIVV